MIFTADQQLYKVLVDIKWAYPARFKHFIPRLGGMHLLMSFIGSIGSLMANSGLEEILKHSFAGVEKMLTGKKYPMNLGALRMVVEELLQSKVTFLSQYSELTMFLDTVSGKRLTAKHWVENLIKPVFICLLYVRAEREGEWPLHLAAVESMLPYFYAARHHNYAQYGSYYLQNMGKLPQVLERFMKGDINKVTGTVYGPTCI